MTDVTEIAPDIYRISTFVPEANLGFAQFLVRDDEPLLFHTGLRQMFPVVREAVASVIDPHDLRWIAFSQVEADECGSLNEWLEVAPQASAMCKTNGILESLAELQPRVLATMHGSSFLGDGAQALRDLATVMQETLEG